ncbi:cobalt ECF transporter T component CbiQ [Duganella sp.]|uniref:cobalt ECF transporter T component CbiQ n=1 Tax=Duganella sp. TaxID=1904440 RepID=UPI0031D7792F
MPGGITVLIESSAYANRWRVVAPSAKALFALAGIVAAWLARSPAVLWALTFALLLAALLGARVPARTYLAAALPPLGFLLLSCLSMLFGPDAQGNWRWSAVMLPAVTHTALRSLAMLAALLGLILTTPLPDLLALMRRLRTPALLLDMMVLCYRMLHVLRQAWDESTTAQSARLGYRGWREAWRSTGMLAGQMAVQVWQRAAALQMAADARAFQGALRFLPAAYPQARRQQAWAALGGAIMIAIGAGDRW